MQFHKFVHVDIKIILTQMDWQQSSRNSTFIITFQYDLINFKLEIFYLPDDENKELKNRVK